MKLDDLLSSLPFYQLSNAVDDLVVNSIQIDDRMIEKNDVFICIKGYSVDGHEFVNNAIEKGAIAIISEKHMKLPVPVIVVSDTKRALAMLAAKRFNYPTDDLNLIGITGTNGKTTITYLLEEIFTNYHKKTGLIGTIQMKIGKKSFEVQNTTPNALELQRFFLKMCHEKVDQAIMEVSSHALDQGRVFGCDFDIAIFSNLSQDHLDYHETMDDYLHAKSLLFSQLGNGYKNIEKYAIINKDDQASTLLIKSTSQKILTYAIEKEADILAENIKLEITGTCFTLRTPVGIVEINSNLIGKFNVYNMLAATGAALARNIPLRVIQQTFANVPAIPGRFESISLGQSYAVIIDYAHTPDSLMNVLLTINEFARNKVYTLIGCGGDRDKEKRPVMAKIAADHADYAIFTSDNPRTENPQSILKDMTEGIASNKKNYIVIEDRSQAIYEVIKKAKKDDIVLIAGKGHETYQQIGTVKYNFDDKKVAIRAIKNKGK